MFQSSDSTNLKSAKHGKSYLKFKKKRPTESELEWSLYKTKILDIIRLLLWSMHRFHQIIYLQFKWVWRWTEIECRLYEILWHFEMKFHAKSNDNRNEIMDKIKGQKSYHIWIKMIWFWYVFNYQIGFSCDLCTVKCMHIRVSEIGVRREDEMNIVCWVN